MSAQSGLTAQRVRYEPPSLDEERIPEPQPLDEERVRDQLSAAEELHFVGHAEPAVIAAGSALGGVLRLLGGPLAGSGASGGALLEALLAHATISTTEHELLYHLLRAHDRLTHGYTPDPEWAFSPVDTADALTLMVRLLEGPSSSPVVAETEARRRRADLRKDLQSGRVSATPLLLDPPEWLLSLPVFDLLVSVRGFGQVSVGRILDSLRIPKSTTISALSARQQSELAWVLRNKGAAPNPPAPLTRSASTGPAHDTPGASDVIASAEPEPLTLELSAVLRQQLGWDQPRVRRLLDSLDLAEDQLVRNLSPGQRLALLEALEATNEASPFLPGHRSSVVNRGIDALLPEAPPRPSVAQTLQFAQNAEARWNLLHEFGYLTADEIGDSPGLQQGKPIAVRYRERILYPGFQFKDGTADLRPEVELVLTALPAEDMSPWELALWWTTANGWLDGARPVDLVDKESRRVAEAAAMLAQPSPL